MKARLFVLLAAGGAVTALSSCGDPTALEAQFENRIDQAIVFALNGTPTTLPSGLSLRARRAVRVDANFGFDLAFDINDANQVVAYTVRKVGTQLVLGHPVGLQLSEQPFDAILEAPTTGYKYDSLVVFPGNRTLLVDNIDPSCSSFSILGPNIRAKVRLDSVKLADRSIFVTMLVNQNCGFKGLAPGFPPE